MITITVECRDQYNDTNTLHDFYVVAHEPPHTVETLYGWFKYDARTKSWRIGQGTLHSVNHNEAKRIACALVFAMDARHGSGTACYSGGHR